MDQRLNEDQVQQLGGQDRQPKDDDDTTTSSSEASGTHLNDSTENTQWTEYSQSYTSQTIGDRTQSKNVMRVRDSTGRDELRVQKTLPDGRKITKVKHRDATQMIGGSTTAGLLGQEGPTEHQL